MRKVSLQQLKPFLRLQPAIAIGVLAVCAGVILVASKIDRGSASAAIERNAKQNSSRFYPSAAQWATLKIEPVELHQFRSEFATEGKIVFDEDRATRIYSLYAGRVKSLAAGPGNVVRKGQLLFVIDAADSADTQKDFISALSALNTARSDVKLKTIIERRMANLIKDKAMAQKDWEEAEANLIAAKETLRTAEIALQAVRNRLRLIGKTDEEIDTFEKTGVISPDAPVYSPLAGTILQRNVGPGQYVDAGGAGGDPIFRIGDVSKVWLAVYVRETDAANVRIGQPITFTVLTHPGRTFEAKINYVASTFVSDSRRLLVQATIDNSEGLLKPEMFANVRIAVDESTPAPAVPRNAIIYEGNDARVWVTHERDSIELRRIKTGIASGNIVQVLDGLRPGDRVVTEGSLFIDRAATAES